METAPSTLATPPTETPWSWPPFPPVLPPPIPTVFAGVSALFCIFSETPYASL